MEPAVATTAVSGKPGSKSFGPVLALIAVPLVALAALAIAVAASWVASGLFGAPEDAVRLERMEGFTLLFWGVAVAALLLVLVALRGADRRETLALGGTLGWMPMLAALLVMAFTFVAELWLASAFPHLRELFDLPDERVALAIAVAGVVVTAPVAEEMLFRGFLYTALRRCWGFVPALAVSSILFAAMHFDPTGLYALLVLPAALLFGWLRERTGGIFAPILAHAVFNAAAVAAFLIERGA